MTTYIIERDIGLAQLTRLMKGEVRVAGKFNPSFIPDQVRIKQLFSDAKENYTNPAAQFDEEFFNELEQKVQSDELSEKDANLLALHFEARNTELILNYGQTTPKVPQLSEDDILDQKAELARLASRQKREKSKMKKLTPEIIQSQEEELKRLGKKDKYEIKAGTDQENNIPYSYLVCLSNNKKVIDMDHAIDTKATPGEIYRKIGDGDIDKQNELEDFISTDQEISGFDAHFLAERYVYKYVKELANFKLEQEFLTRPPSRISISPSPEPETSPNQNDSSPITALQTPSERGGKS
jgi:hypothetical protein